MDVAPYMELLVRSRNVVWPDARQFYGMRLNAQDVTSEKAFVDDREYLSAVGGWIKRWSHIHQRGDLRSTTEGFCDIPWVGFCEEADYQKRVAPLVYDEVAKEVIPELYMDLFCLSRPLDTHSSIISHRHFYTDLDLETGLRWDPDLGKVFVGWHNLESFSFQNSKPVQHYVMV